MSFRNERRSNNYNDYVKDTSSTDLISDLFTSSRQRSKSQTKPVAPSAAHSTPQLNAELKPEIRLIQPQGQAKRPTPKKTKPQPNTDSVRQLIKNDEEARRKKLKPDAAPTPTPTVVPQSTLLKRNGYNARKQANLRAIAAGENGVGSEVTLPQHKR